MPAPSGAVEEGTCRLQREHGEQGSGDWLGALLLHQHLKNARQAAGNLDKIVQEMILMNSSRVGILLQSPLFRALAFLLAVGFVANAADNLATIQRNGVTSARAFRFTALELSGRPGETAEVPGVSRFALLLDGCESDGRGSTLLGWYLGRGSQKTLSRPQPTLYNSTVRGSQITLDFENVVDMNGWFFEEAPASVGYPVNFLVEARVDGHVGEGGWTAIGAPSWVYIDSGGYRLIRHATKRIQAAYDLRPPLEFIIRAVGVPSMVAVCLLVVSAFASRDPNMAEWILIDLMCGGLAFWSIFVLAVGAESFRAAGSGDGRDEAARVSSLCEITLSASLFVSCIFVIFAKRAEVLDMWRALFVVGVALISRDVIFQLVVELSSTYYPSYFQFGIFFILLFPLIWQMMANRYSAGRWDKEAIKGVDFWEETWRGIVAHNAAELVVLKTYIDQVQASTTSSRRQLNRLRKNNDGGDGDEMWADISTRDARGGGSLHERGFVLLSCGSGVPGAIDVSRPVMSLDQLYAQATGLQAFLDSKARDWTRTIGSTKLYSNGKRVDSLGLGLSQSHETTSQSSTPKATASASAGAACASLKVQEGLKGMSRALQKIQRGYEGDVSRLLDVCRKRIVFENPRDIVECFKIIVSDRDVVICGITNDYESGYNAKESAGLRMVVVNLRIDSKQTRMLGIETHVCELQMVLRQVVEKQDAALHAMSPSSFSKLIDYKRRMRMQSAGQRSKFWATLRDLTGRFRRKTARIGRRLSLVRGASSKIMGLNRPRFDDSQLLPQSCTFSLPSFLKIFLVDAGDARNVRKTLPTQKEVEDDGHLFSWGKQTPMREGEGEGIGEGLVSKRIGVCVLPSPDPAPEEATLASEGSSIQAPASGIQPFQTSPMMKPTTTVARQRNSRPPPLSRILSGSDAIGKAFSETVLMESTQEEWENQWRRFLVYHYTNATLGISTFIAVTVKKVTSAMALASTMSTFYTSTPIQSAMTKPWLRFFGTLMALYLASEIVTAVVEQDASKVGNWQMGRMAKVFKFTALQERGGNVATLPGIISFGPLSRGCSVGIDSNPTLRSEGPSMFLEFDRAPGVPIDGWQLDTSDVQDPVHDSARFKIEMQNVDGSWTKIGASSWNFVGVNILVFDEYGEPGIPLEREGSLVFDYRRPTFIPIYFYNSHFVFMLTFAILILMAFNDSYKYMSMVVSFGFFCVAVCELSCFVAAYTQGHRMQSISILTYAFADSFAVYWFYFQEIHTLRHILVLGVWWTLNWVIGTVLYDPQAQRGPEIIGTSCIVLSIVFMVFRRISLNRAQELVQENEKLYAREWDAVLSREASTDSLRVLESVCENLSKKSEQEGSIVRQCNRLNMDASGNGNKFKANFKSRFLDMGSGIWGSHPFLERHSSPTTPTSAVQSPVNRIEESQVDLVCHVDDPSGPPPAEEDLQEAADVIPAHVLIANPWMAHGLSTSNVQMQLRGQEGELDYESPVKSLDQLYAQASGLYPVFLAKTKEWAYISEGQFFKVGGGFVNWREAKAQGPAGELMNSIKWAQMKSPSRAVEKLVRAYKGDESRLLDLCRQSIIFDTIEEVTQCLQNIENDPEVVVVRVKNRYTRDYDGKETAGYRDVSLNLRIDNEVTRGLGVETHVCELKLLLTSYANLVSDRGHKQYVMWRNMRGE